MLLFFNYINRYQSVKCKYAYWPSLEIIYIVIRFGFEHDDDDDDDYYNIIILCAMAHKDNNIIQTHHRLKIREPRWKGLGVEVRDGLPAEFVHILAYLYL